MDERVAAVIGADAFRADVLAAPGLDDRPARGGYLARAEELMADAVGAQRTFFATCGSSLSVKAAMVRPGDGFDGSRPRTIPTCTDPLIEGAGRG